MYKITFQIEGATPVVMEANKGDNLLELARRGNVAIDAPCSGNGSCGKCRVKLVSGAPSPAETLFLASPPVAVAFAMSFSSSSALLPHPAAAPRQDGGTGGPPQWPQRPPAAPRRRHKFPPNTGGTAPPIPPRPPARKSWPGFPPSSSWRSPRLVCCLPQSPAAPEGQRDPEGPGPLAHWARPSPAKWQNPSAAAANRGRPPAPAL